MRLREEALVHSINTFYSKHTGIELIFVCQNYTLPDKIESECNEFYDPNKGNIPTEIRLDYPVFNKGWCINVGARAAKYDTICIAESDMWAPDPFLNDAVKYINNKEYRWCFGWNKLLYTSEVEREKVLSGESFQLVSTGINIVAPKVGGSEGGFVLFNKKFFFDIGGCNEWFEELGGPDNELARRAGDASHTYIKYHQFVYHLWHKPCRDNELFTRKHNRILYCHTVANIQKTNRLLRKQPFGNIESPLCSTKSYEELWNESHQDAPFA